MECKYFSHKYIIVSIFELIDTLWNVNIAHPESLQPQSGINRYIMECKC